MKKSLLWALLSWLSLLSFGARAQTNVLLAQENFENGTPGTNPTYGYTANNFQVTTNTQYFQRQQLSAGAPAYPGTSQQVTNQEGSFAWTAEGVRGTGTQTVRSAGYVVLNPVNATGYNNFSMTVAFADPSGTSCGTCSRNAVLASDRVRLQYSFDGGPFVTAGLLVNSSSGYWQQDASTPLDSVGNGTVIDQNLQDITARISGTGSSLRVRVVCDFRSPILVFDNIRVYGQATSVATPTLGGLETTAATYTEGGSPVQLTNSLTVGYSGSSTLTGGTVSVSANFASGDRLNFSTQNGITGLYDANNGILTLTGTASLAAYETALRSITYSNTNTTNLNTGTRQITFQVRNGSVVSNSPVRGLNITGVLNAAASLNYTEDFNADGDGTRYFGNTWADVSNVRVGSFRATSSPASFNGTQIGSATFTGWSGGYWFGEVPPTTANPTNPYGLVQLAPVNATGRSNIRFTVAIGAAGPWLGYLNANNVGDQFELFYSTDGGATLTKFGAFYGVDGTTPARQDADLDPLTPAAGTLLSTALQDFTFNIPASAAVSNLTFVLRQRSRAGGIELAYDNIRITAAVAPTVTTNTPATSITTTSAVLGGNITSNGDGNLTERGVVYVVGTGTPTVSNTKALVSTSGVTTGAFSGTVAGLSPGTTYTVRAYAINEAGPGYGASVTFTTLAPVGGTTVVTNVSCNGGTNGAINLTPTGGVAPYTFLWSPGGQTTEDRTGLAAGTYSVTITDATGATGTVSNIIVTQPSALTATTSQTNVTTNGGNNGSATITVSGGTPGYSYVWNPNVSTTATASNLSAGTYSVTASDANGCNITRTFTITQPAFTATAQAVTVNLDASGNGTLNASSVNNGSSGAGTLTYTIQKIAFGKVNENSDLTLTTPNGANFSAIRFASYGTPSENGLNSGNYSLGSCNAANSLSAAQNAYVGRSSGTMYASNTDTRNNPVLGDPCGGTPKALAVQVGYSADAASLTYNCTEAGKTQYVLLTVTNGTSTSTAVAQVTVNAPPTATITSVNPTSTQRGGTVIVAGTNLSGVSSVTVNGATATVSNVTSTGFTFVVPSTATFGPGSLVVATPCAQTLTNTFTVLAPTIVVAPAALPNGQQGTAYSQALSASGGTAPYTFAITAGALPAGLTLTNGTIAGTPTVNGTFNFTVTATDASAAPGPYSGSRSYTLAINAQPQTAAPVITTPANGSFSNIRSVTATGTAPAGSIVSIYIGVNLAGTASASAAGAFSFAIPGNAPDGTYTVSATAQSSGATVSPSSNVNTFTIDGTAPNATLSSSVASGGTTTTTPVSFTATFNEPVTGLTAAGLTVTNGTVTSGPTAGANNTYTFQVTPRTAGTVTVQVAANAAQDRATNGNTASAPYSFTFAAPTIVVAPAALNNGQQGVAYSQALSASGGTSPYSYAITAGALPAGLTLTNGTIAGTPTVNGTFNFTVTATDASAAPGPYSGSRSYTLAINAQPQTAAPVVTAPANGSFSNIRSVTATGTAPAGSTVSVFIGSNLAGTTPASASGTFSYLIPGTAPDGTYTVSATAQSSGATVSPSSNVNTFTIDGTAPTASLTSPVASGGSTTTTPVSFTATFNEPVTGLTAAGLTVTNGTVSSGPTAGANNTYTFQVTPRTAGTVTVQVAANAAQDRATNGNTASALYSFTFVAPTIVVAPAALNNGQQGVAYSQALSATGGTSPYSYAITAGALPAGLTLTNGTIAGTPTTNGTFNFTVTATDASTAPGPYSGSQAYSLVITAPAITATTWTGTISTDWFTAGNWTQGVPDATIDATIPTAPSGGRFPNVSAGTASARNLTFDSGATLTQSGGTLALAANLTNNGTFLPTGGTVNLGTTAFSNIFGASSIRFWNLTVGTSGAQLSTSIGASMQRLLTLNGNFSTNGNSFVLESNNTLTALVVNNTTSVVTGTVTVQRAIDPSVNPGLGYRHYSSPVSNSTVGDLATSGFTPVVNPAFNTDAMPYSITPYPTVYGYDDSRLSLTNNLDMFDKGYFSPSALSDPLAVGKGYTVNIAASEVVDFQGTLNNGNLSLNLTSTRNTYPADGGWQFLGNPYPAPLDYSRVAAADRLGLESAIYVFTSTSQYMGRYRVYINGIGNPVVPLGQGFFTRVAAGQSTATMTFRNSHRLTAPNGTTLQRTTADPRPLVQLTLQSQGAAPADEAYVYFENGATTGFEPAFDAEKLPNPTGFNLSTTQAGKQLSIDGQPELGTAQRVVPLAVGVPAAGVYTFTASQLLNLSATPVYLRDLQLGTLTDLRQQPTYQFTVSNASALNTTRFALVFSPQQALATVPAALAEQVGLYPNPARTQVAIELPLSLSRQPVTAALLDALGRVVRTQVLPAGLATHSLLLADLASGMYSLRLTTDKGMVVKKLVIE